MAKELEAAFERYHEKLDFILDEGMFVMKDIFPGLNILIFLLVRLQARKQRCLTIPEKSLFECQILPVRFYGALSYPWMSFLLIFNF